MPTNSIPSNRPSAARGLFLLLVAGLAGCSPSSPGDAGGSIRFRDDAPAAGIDHHLVSGGQEKLSIVENIGTGVALLDADGDGHLDLFLANGGRIEEGRVVAGPGLALYLQLGSSGKFEEASGRLGLDFDGWATGVAVGDYDSDGDLDIFLACWGPDQLWENRDGRFVERGEDAGVAHQGLSTSAVFLDYDLDGKLDLYVASYLKFDLSGLPNDGQPCMEGGARVACGPGFYEPEPDRLYRNEGGGRFRLVSSEAGMANAEGGYGLGLAVDDFNLDGLPDIYVANDTTGNYLWLNQGGGKFTDGALMAGASLSPEGQGQAGMGVAAGDCNGDGNPDIFVTNYSQEQNSLYLGIGAGEFAESSAASGFSLESFIALGWSTFFADLDNDTDDDLFVANGHVHPGASKINSSLSYLQPCHFFLNDGKGMFELCPPSVGELAVEPRAHRGAAYGDIDEDGDIDILLSVQDGPPVLLMNQLAGGGNSLLVELAGSGGNREGIGARLSGKVGGKTLTRTVGRGAGYLSSSDCRAHFGLGLSRKLDTLDIRWPSGKNTRLLDLKAGFLYRVEEGSGKAVAVRGLKGGS